MLVLMRKVNEDILIGDDVVVRVVEIAPGRVKLAVEAPKHVAVDRREVRESKDFNPRTSEEPK